MQNHQGSGAVRTHLKQTDKNTFRANGELSLTLQQEAKNVMQTKF